MKTESDFELAFPDVDETLLTWGNSLPLGYSTEIRGRGYGLVIRNDTLSKQLELNELMLRFFTPLLPMVKAMRDTSCILRVALFTSYVTTTARLNVDSLELLTQFQAKLELSV